MKKHTCHKCHTKYPRRYRPLYRHRAHGHYLCERCWREQSDEVRALYPLAGIKLW